MLKILFFSSFLFDYFILLLIRFIVKKTMNKIFKETIYDFKLYFQPILHVENKFSLNFNSQLSNKFTLKNNVNFKPLINSTYKFKCTYNKFVRITKIFKICPNLWITERYNFHIKILKPFQFLVVLRVLITLHNNVSVACRLLVWREHRNKSNNIRYYVCNLHVRNRY